MRLFSIVFLMLVAVTLQAQELFVVTEPASNVPAGSISVRVGQSVLQNQEGGSMYNLAPEVTWGITKDVMIRTSAYLNNMHDGLNLRGGGIYAKYRFLSVDDLQSHFRMAAFGRYSWNNGIINHEGIDMMGSNTGYEAGIVATQLLKKIALSTSLSHARAYDNHQYDFPDLQGSSALNYTFSVGRLMYPKRYTSFKQTNINTMLELVGQTITANGKSYLDIVPSIQFIINSQARIDIAYKKELYNSMQRFTSDGIFLKMEYTFFNVTK